VGNMGKGVTNVKTVLDKAGLQDVTNVKTVLDKAGLQDVTMRLYAEGRHEMLNELNKDEVMNDILAWVEAKIK
ncbi:MAG: hypothetical protein IIV42_06515, partial [Peptococcaceae bacterium]|nr:hypothetical protein [Peptococcaceae bacterium]